jgi:hypothetical protein
MLRPKLGTKCCALDILRDPLDGNREVNYFFISLVLLCVHACNEPITYDDE